MANTFIKAAQIVQAATLLLQREIVLPRLVWRQADANFVGALNDTITLRVPAVRVARTRVMRSATALVADDLAETSVPVKLDTHVYDLLNITDEQLTLDIVDFTTQVLNPQMRGVAEGLEDVIGTELAAANVAAGQELTPLESEEPYDMAVDAARILNDLKVGRVGRTLLVGSEVEAWLLKSDKLSKVNESGSDSALRDAIITRVAGFTVVGSQAIASDVAYAFHATAIALAVVAPALPSGAVMKERVSIAGLALRFLRDYNPTNATGPVDRSLVDAFVGAVSVEEAGNNNRLVKIDLAVGS